MKKQFFIANWKSHKNTLEAKNWLQEFSIFNPDSIGINSQVNKEIILCPPFPLLPICHEFIQKHNLPISLGSQTISSYPEGAYTGEVSARVLKDYVNYTLIGHSERRSLFEETEGDVRDKVKMALSHQIKPILLIGPNIGSIPKGVDIVIYEPPSAISSGNSFKPENPDEVEKVARLIKKKKNISFVLYGGSVTPENIKQYTDLPSINGAIIGAKSLDPNEFSAIIQNS